MPKHLEGLEVSEQQSLLPVVFETGVDPLLLEVDVHLEILHRELSAVFNFECLNLFMINKVLGNKFGNGIFEM